MTSFPQGETLHKRQPSDTATLGLIRICAGFLTLYIHLVYSYEFFELVGKDAWISQDLAAQVHEEYPIAEPDLGWPTGPRTPPPSARLT